MKILYLTTSLIKGMSDCPDRAMHSHLTRQEHGNDYSETDATVLGNVMHEVGEVVHQYDMKGEASPDPVGIFEEMWGRRSGFDIDRFKLGRSQVAAFIDRSLYQRTGETIATEFSFLIDLVKMRAWVIDRRESVDVEWLCQKVIADGGVPVISTIDRVDRDGPLFEVFDYKTNAQPFTRDEVETSEQLILYDIAVRLLWPEAEETRCTFDMLRHGRFSAIFSDQDREDLRSYLIVMWQQIQNMDVPPARLNRFCSWCLKKEECPEYVGALSGELPHPYANDMSLDKAWAEFDRLKTIEKLARERVASFDEALMAKITDADSATVDLGDGTEVYLQPNPRPEYPMEQVLPVLTRHKAVTLLRFCGKVSRPELDKLLRGRDKLKAEIEPLLVVNYVKPSLKNRKIKLQPTTPKKKAKK